MTYLTKQSNKETNQIKPYKLNPKWKLKQVVNKYLEWNHCGTGKKTCFFVQKWNQYGQGLIDLLHKRVSERN